MSVIPSVTHSPSALFPGLFGPINSDGGMTESPPQSLQTQTTTDGPPVFANVLQQTTQQFAGPLPQEGADGEQSPNSVGLSGMISGQTEPIENDPEASDTTVVEAVPFAVLCAACELPTETIGPDQQQEQQQQEQEAESGSADSKQPEVATKAVMSIGGHDGPVDADGRIAKRPTTEEAAAKNESTPAVSPLASIFVPVDTDASQVVSDTRSEESEPIFQVEARANGTRDIAESQTLTDLRADLASQFGIPSNRRWLVSQSGLQQNPASGISSVSPHEENPPVDRMVKSAGPVVSTIPLTTSDSSFATQANEFPEASGSTNDTGDQASAADQLQQTSLSPAAGSEASRGEVSEINSKANRDANKTIQDHNAGLPPGNRQSATANPPPANREEPGFDSAGPSLPGGEASDLISPSDRPTLPLGTAGRFPGESIANAHKPDTAAGEQVGILEDPNQTLLQTHDTDPVQKTTEALSSSANSQSQLTSSVSAAALRNERYQDAERLAPTEASDSPEDPAVEVSRTDDVPSARFDRVSRRTGQTPLTPVPQPSSQQVFPGFDNVTFAHPKAAFPGTNAKERSADLMLDSLQTADADLDVLQQLLPKEPATPVTSSPTAHSVASMSHDHLGRLNLPGQIATRVLSEAEVLDSGDSANFRMKLDPPELGSVLIEMQKTLLGTTITVTAVDPATQQLLQDSLQNLNQTNSGALGLFDNLTFDLSNGDQGHQQDHEDPQSHSRVVRLAKGETAMADSDTNSETTSAVDFIA